MNKDTTVSMGTWQRPPCLYCDKPVEATSHTEEAPLYLREYLRWAHWTCVRAKQRSLARQAVMPVVEEVPRRTDRGWKSVGQVLEDMGPPPWRDV